jgi:translation initiation factor 2 subunit 2
MDNYEKLLDKAYEKVKKSNSSERFEIPKVEGRYEGKKTIITNFAHIVSKLRRDAIHFQKFLLKELAASGYVDGERLILNIKVSREKIDSKIEKYAREYVLCKECQKPDTELIKQDRLTFIHCLACGAKHAVSKV